VYVFLAVTGGRVFLPDAVAVTDGDSEAEVRFVDAGGRVLALFRRGDVAMYSMQDFAMAVDEPADGNDSRLRVRLVRRLRRRPGWRAILSGFVSSPSDSESNATPLTPGLLSRLKNSSEDAAPRK
jgi:hypothetical protein